MFIYSLLYSLSKNLQAVPILHAAMSRKTEIAYDAVINEALKYLNPETIKVVMSDFEEGLRNSITSNIPQATVAGCNWHFDHVSYKLYLILVFNC